MPESRRDTTRVTNLDTWNNPDVASYYSSLDYLTACERLFFDAYLKAGMAILDLGVGGGRTTPYLSAIAGRYVGADYAEEMIIACRNKFSEIEFRVVDASELSMFATSGFDAIVLAFNTIDNIIPDEARYRALQEIYRVMKPKGVLIFSSHNIRAIVVRPQWNRQRLINLAQRLARDDSVWYRPLLGCLISVRILLAFVRSIVQSTARIVSRFPTRAFWRGEGYLADAEHGGTRIHHSTPKTTKEELARFGFRFLRVLGDDYPKASGTFITDWYYYAFERNSLEKGVAG